MRTRLTLPVIAGLTAVMASAGLGCQRAPSDPDRPTAAAREHDVAAREHDAVAAAAASHVCPMHPEVRSPEPGSCPKCGMPLEPTAPQTRTAAGATTRPAATRPATAGAPAAHGPAAVHVDPRRVQWIGVKTALVERRPLLIPVRAPARITYDETRLSDVSIRYPAWVGKLYVDREGQLVRRGQALFTLYSYELYMAQRELHNALELDLRASGVSQVDEARRRLQRLNVSDAQIDEMSKREVELDYVPIHSEVSGYVVEKNVVAGSGIAAGQRLYRIARLDEVWVEADVYLADLPLIAEGAGSSVTRAKVTVTALPGASFEGPITYVYPFIVPGSPTGRVRITLDNPDLALRPGMYAEVRIDVDRGPRLGVPESAVIYSGPRRLVFVDLGDGHFEPREVGVGARGDGVLEINSGLAEGERVVVSGNFLIAAESRLKSATDTW